MKKKIISIFLVGMFILVGLTNFCIAKNYTPQNIIKKNSLSSNAMLIASAYTFIGEVALPNACIEIGDITLPAGEYTMSYEIEYLELPYDERAVGFWYVLGYIGPDTFFEIDSSPFDYVGTNKPENIFVEVTKNIPNYGFPHNIPVYIQIGYYYDIYHSTGDHMRKEINCDDDQLDFYFSKGKTADLPLLRFLDNHQVLFKLVQQLLKI